MIEINKFSELHNGETIFFCKTDFLIEDLKLISRLDHKITLITGNSDYSITDEIVQLAPPNIKVWYAQNCLSNADIMRPLPIGLENKLPSYRPGHGVGYFDRASTRENLILNIDKTISPNRFIYSNFNVYTNLIYRQPLKAISQRLDHIDWEDPVLTLEQLYDNIMKYKMILCPVGNGIDTHRLWEVLYLNRIPITMKVGNFNIYNLYQQLPILCLDNIDQLKDKKYIESQYVNIINNLNNKRYNLNLLNELYWKELIS